MARTPSPITSRPGSLRILTGIDGVSFDEAWASREQVDFHGIELFVIGRRALVANKRASGRKKDLVDLALLEQLDDEE